MEENLDDKDKKIAKLEKKTEVLNLMVLEIDNMISRSSITFSKMDEMPLITDLKITNPSLFGETYYELYEQCKSPYILSRTLSSNQSPLLTPLDKDWTTVI
jgi:hypothetical protein